MGPLVEESRVNTIENQQMRQVLENSIYLGISKYTDTFLIVVNQTGSMGSLVSFA
jgi:hypothetical protein